MSPALPNTACRPGRLSLLARRLKQASLCVLAFVILYRPMASGLVASLPSSVVFGLLLLGCLYLRLAGKLLSGEVWVQFGLPGAVFSAFIGASLASALLGENWFGGLEWCVLLATYGSTGFLTARMAREERERRFLLSCLLASAVALAAFGLWHYALYMPSLRTYLRTEPYVFRAAVGATGPMARDLEARVAAERAYGSFITPNQLADFLVVGIFPLIGYAVGFWEARREARSARWLVWILTCCVGSALALLYLTGSKGGWAAFVFGLVIVGLTAGWWWVRWHRRAVLAATAAAVVLALVAFRVGALPAPQRFADSLGVRLGYWQTSIRIGLERPLLGTGPGSWADWYAMLKEPEFEETRDPHSLYFRLWAETGATGLLLWGAFWVALFAQGSGRGRDRVEAQSEAPGGTGQPCTAERLRWLTGAGLGLAAAALAFDYGLMGTFLPPKYVPAWLVVMPWLPYMGLWAVWAAAFVVFFRSPAPRQIAVSGWALMAGLAAFLFHSAAEFTLEVPAIGSTVAVLCGFLLARSGARPQHKVQLGPAGQVALLAGLGGCVLLWSGLVTRRVMTAAASASAADATRLELVADAGSPQRPERAEDVRARINAATSELRNACAALPWDDGAWRELAAWLLEAGDRSTVAEAAHAAQRAVELNRLHSANWSLLGRARALSGDSAGAAEAYGRAAMLHRSLPEAWYRFGEALEAAGRSREAAECYGRGLGLMPRQYHCRNLVLGTPSELARLWGETGGGTPGASLLAVAADLGARIGGMDIPAGVSEKELLLRLTEGLPGAPELVRKWDSYDASARERELWDVLAGRLWGWALRAKLQSLGPAAQGRGIPERDGAGGGT